ncbi:Dynein light chain 1, cytoplasmic [Echinococcus granulosus]|uniref:Dynein light chain 1, cytoplasmic n=2 Tax=Echinococcus TaxID=6209 RepID=U6J1J8_ECHGR|nr:Dynein light chain 1, cytoplasmic [Echinococcus granulosus]EUB64450.1 Dynein light chain 1, cytoplasmic [Echinococcus granulosus]KAH9282790.1 Dynein light chain 1, cytoplasmic [Echinococcus granulosus]CDS17176.1 Dynein light chain type 1 2 [Echinococcus granulosus]CDS42204.1 Dynein light chain type 1 2 [Echinococcus multilocularis]
MQTAITNPQCAKPHFKTADVDDYKRRIILQSVHKADLLYCTEDEMAKSIRIDLNNKLGGHWHVIVGRHFASYFTFTPGFMAHLILRDIQFLVYQYEQVK